MKPPKHYSHYLDTELQTTIHTVPTDFGSELTTHLCSRYIYTLPRFQASHPFPPPLTALLRLWQKTHWLLL